MTWFAGEFCFKAKVLAKKNMKRYDNKHLKLLFYLRLR